MERCTKVEKGHEDDRNDKSQPNHSYVNLPQIKWGFLVYLIIFCVRSSSKRPLEESITWRKPRPKEIRSAGFMAFCWLGGRLRRYTNMVQRHLNSHVRRQVATSANVVSVIIVCDTYLFYELLGSVSASSQKTNETKLTAIFRPLAPGL